MIEFFGPLFETTGGMISAIGIIERVLAVLITLFVIQEMVKDMKYTPVLKLIPLFFLGSGLFYLFLIIATLVVTFCRLESCPIPYIVDLSSVFYSTIILLISIVWLVFYKKKEL